jgi:hypothetical protein
MKGIVSADEEQHLLHQTSGLFAFVAHNTDDEKATIPSRQGTSG